MTTTPDFPVIDIRRWREGTAQARYRLSRELDVALRQSGFLLVSGHGVSAELRAAVRASAARFFALPAGAKSAYATHVGGRGWIPPGSEANSYYGQPADAARADLKESLTNGRTFATGDRDTDREWFGANVWPAECPELEALCERFTGEVRALYDDLLRACAMAFGLPESWFVDRVQRGPHTLNINRYPPRAETGAPLEGQFRVAPHTDWGVLTILDRQPGYGGLQVEARDGRWTDAPHEPDTLTVNVGDLLARWTGDRWRSTRHRVLPPPAEAPDEELISLIVFLECDVDAVVEPLAAGAAYPPVVAGTYLLERAGAATVA
ncbi:isopenicillin N synthase family oxygenase [Frankia sp. CNm7]|uniref:Isopenicillin N synthase family oxygenase n=1 Tax=Frankia nepalensis TaxID=1836974 RepID=A0A937RN70_9ACTN|nr:2-oxoglutarate and iron-dependent oxygenase domain-containing protein [Frankia nepalensis]MBL7499490.1 isopenicillin N synthase family oxygenase [Frankia nepalensis]MBL7515803.1 isopenicillin N synthase family oxygenase [Frankia nepalensis]MBL7523057.1 isopenicillin N synthase family oxygenase [Frankia nepalensis]MBL7631864.1 isopenicillin N synthase family oxygenase [Frankia nepalensis]